VETETSEVGENRYSRRNFYLCSVFIMILSILLSPFLGHHYDPNVIAYVGVQLTNGISPYSQAWWYSYAYPPLYLYYSAFVQYLLNDIPLSALPEYRIPPLHLLLIKLPSIISHQAIATTLYYSTSPRFPRCLSFVYLFSPFPIFISAIWGNIDEICALFILLAGILLYQGKWTTAGILWGVACSLKVYVFLFIVIIPMLVINKKQGAPFKRFLSFVLASSGFFLIVSLPFLVWDPNGFISTLLWRIGFAGWTHDLGLSYGVLLALIVHFGGSLFSFVSLIPITVFLILLSYFVIRLVESKTRIRNFDKVNSLILALVLMALVATIVVNEMDYVWALPLLLLYWSTRHEHFSRKFMILNIILLIALMVDWTPLDFIPGIDPAIVINYQNESVFRGAVLMILGLYISIKVVFHEIFKISRGLKNKGE